MNAQNAARGRKPPRTRFVLLCCYVVPSLTELAKQMSGRYLRRGRKATFSSVPDEVIAAANEVQANTQLKHTTIRDAVRRFENTRAKGDSALRHVLEQQR